jgi:hypothetical protein
MRFFRHILTGRDNKTYDIVRVGMLAAIIIICGESLWGVIEAGGGDAAKIGDLMKNFSASIANILGWGSVGCAAKSHTEPER